MKILPIAIYFSNLLTLIKCQNIENHIFNQTSRFTIAVDGSFLYPQNDGTIGGFFLRYLGQFETLLKRLSINLMNEARLLDKNEKNIVVLDIGANLGVWSIPLANSIGKLGRVYSFEPQRDMISYLHSNILANNLQNIFPFHAAISNTSGFIILNQNISHTNDSPLNYGGFTINNLDSTSYNDQLSTYYVQTFRLDDLYNNHIFECPDLIKIDVEMHELNVFIGSIHMLQECKPILLFEANCKELMHSILSLLNNVGYTMAWIKYPEIDIDMKWIVGDYYISPISYGFFNDEINSEWFVSAINVIAVPKSKKQLIDNNIDGLIPIDFENGKYYIDDYDTKFCYRDAWCAKCKHGFCSNYSIISEYLVNYWEKFE